MPVNSTTRIETLVSVEAEASYAISPQDTLAVITAIPSGGTVVELPSTPSSGDAYEVADADGSCSSGTPITLTVTGAGQTIQGADTLALTQPFAWARVTFSEPRRAWVAFQAAQGAPFARSALPYTTIYVDPQDETGHASNANPGTNPDEPIATTTHLNAINFFGNLTADTLIQYLSDDTSGVGLQLATLYLGNFTLTVAQTPQVLHTGGTLAAGTVAIDPAANQPQVVHTSDLAAFAPYVVTQNGGSAANGVRVTDTSSLAGAWIMSAATPAAPQTTRPILPDGTAGALTSGHGYTLSRGGLLTLALQDPPLATTGTVLFSDCAFTPQSTGFNGANYARCTWAGAVQVGFSVSDGLMASDISATGTSSGASNLSAGGLITNGSLLWSEALVFQGGDTYVTGQGLTVGNGWATALQVYSSDVGPGIQIHDCSGNGLTIFSPFTMAVDASSTNPLVWGKGNAGYGVYIDGNATWTVSSGVPPTLTGELGAVAFVGPAGVGAVAMARAFDETAGGGAGAYTALRATTWANFAASIVSGGFGFQMHSVSSGASLVGV